MLVELHQLAAALYLAAGVAGGIALAARADREQRVSVAMLGSAALVHLVAIVAMHRADPAPQLTDLPAVVSLTAFMTVLAFLAFLRRARWKALVIWIAPAGFLGAFVGALQLKYTAGESQFSGGSWPHAHVLLGIAGLALLGVSGIAGMVFLREARALKAKRRGIQRTRLPSLETLDRVNVAALTVGFPLLTLGVVTGMVWLQAAEGTPWRGAAHEIWTTLGWLIYLMLSVARFRVKQSARHAALSAVGGFLFLLFAVIGVGLMV